MENPGEKGAARNMRPDFKPRYPTLIESRQQEETFYRQSLGNGVEVRLLSFRCHDAQQGDLPCQDYALLVFHQQSSLVFCVSDGVGGSYRGNFAAYYLANRLVDWLQTLPDLHVKAHTLTTQLEPLLHRWAKIGQEQLEKQALPTETPRLLREILLEQRSSHGSETVFFAGRIDYERHPFSQTQQERHAFFCWMGNVSAQLFVPDKYVPLNDEEDAMSDENRWSTRHGPHGTLTGLTMKFSMVERLIVYTDGFVPISKELAELNDERLQSRAGELLHLPANDDMTVLDLQWKDTERSRAEEGQHV